MPIITRKKDENDREKLDSDVVRDQVFAEFTLVRYQ